MEGRPLPRIRPTEMATIASALFLLATALLPGAADVRLGVLVAVLLTLGYIVVWYHVLPPGTFGVARYAVGGSVVQLILLYMLAATGGVGSPWFVFYVLPILATVFSYRPRATATIAIVAAIALVAAAFGEAPTRDPAMLADLLVVRLIGLGAIASMAYLLTRVMRSHRYELERNEERLRGALAATQRDAMTDALTSVHNRRALDQALGQATRRAERDQRPYSVLMIDVDRLKSINDASGHGSGDEALRRVARAATEVVRGYDTVARSGGDEFVVLLYDAHGAAASAIRDRIRARAAELFAAERALSAATISIGIATWRQGLPPDGLLAEADAAMYAEKRERGQASR